MICRPDIVKVAYMLGSEEDARRLTTIRAWFCARFPRQPTIFIGMGKYGTHLRSEFARDGDIVTFASFGKPSAPGQATIKSTHHGIYGNMPFALAREAWQSDTRENLKESALLPPCERGGVTNSLRVIKIELQVEGWRETPEDCDKKDSFSAPLSRGVSARADGGFNENKIPPTPLRESLSSE